MRIASRDDLSTIRHIAKRAVAMAATAGIDASRLDFEMDISACHANGCPLRLEKLLAATDFDFSHDILGIRKNLNRETGGLYGNFHPRYAF